MTPIVPIDHTQHPSAYVLSEAEKKEARASGLPEGAAILKFDKVSSIEKALRIHDQAVQDEVIEILESMRAEIPPADPLHFLAVERQEKMEKDAQKVEPREPERPETVMRHQLEIRPSKLIPADEDLAADLGVFWERVALIAPDLLEKKREKPKKKTKKVAIKKSSPVSIEKKKKNEPLY